MVANRNWIQFLILVFNIKFAILPGSSSKGFCKLKPLTALNALIHLKK